MIIFVALNSSCLRQKKRNNLRIGFTENSFDQAIAYTIKGILDQQPGMKVDLYKVPDSTLFRALAEDELDIGISAWLPFTHQKYFEEYPYEIKKFSVICDSLGIYLLVPQYAPLDKIDDLRNIASLLNYTIIIPENKNAIYHFSKEILNDYRLNDFILQESSWDNIVYFIENAIASSEGFAFIGIRPHWINTNYEVKSLEDTRHSLGDYEQAHLVVNIHFQERMPELASFLSRVKFNLTDIENIMALNQSLGSEPYENSLRWIGNNTLKVNKWLTNN